MTTNDTSVWMLGRLRVREFKEIDLAPLVEKLVDDVGKQGNASQYEYGIRENEVHLYERYPNSDAWEKHVDRFLEHFAEELLETLEPFEMFAYCPVSDSLREKIAAFGFVYFKRIGGL